MNIKMENHYEKLEKRVQTLKDMGFEHVKIGTYREPTSQIELTEETILSYTDDSFNTEIEFLYYILSK